MIEKLMGSDWIIMARFPDSVDHIEGLCEAIGGKMRVQDLATGQTLPEREYA